jgi:hypothetical protein
MTTYTDDQVRQQLDTVLNMARRHGEVRLRAQDGQEYSVRPVASSRSPFDIAGVDLGLSAAEIVAFVRETRER